MEVQKPKTGKCLSLIFFVLFSFLFFPFSAYSQQPTEKSDVITTKKSPNFDSYWKNGFTFQSADKNFALKFGGRIMFDIGWFSQDGSIEDEFGELTSGAEFRRARLFTSGTIYRNVKFKLQLDFSGGVTTFKDMYIQLSKVPGVGNIRVGHFKEPLRLEALTSSKYITFMERSFVANASQERNSGLLIFNDHLDNRLGWQLGVFRNADKFGNDKNAAGKFILTGRVTGLLVHDKENNRVVHVGLGFSRRSVADNELKISVRPSSHLAPKYVSTGTIKQVDYVNLINGEAAVVLGPVSFQGEYLSTMVGIDPTGSYNFSAWYGQVSYFITGEHRPYKSSYSAFSRVKPKKNFGTDGGAGAWEIGVRYSSIDLNDGSISGGVLNDLTIGLNWHLNPATRVMTNYVLADIEDLGKTSIFQMRFQIDF